MRIAINGMGRVGRLLCRRLLQEPGIELVAVNDVMNPDNLAYLLRYDSVYGSTAYEVVYDGQLKMGEAPLECLSEKDPSKLPWKELNVDVVLECTGRFNTGTLAAQHLKAGAQKVLLSTTGSDEIPLLIYGHNQHGLTTDASIISPGGCMTNCATHIIYLMNSIGIESLQLNVIHSYTSRQELVDAPHNDFRRGRAAAESIIPVPVDLADSLQRLFPMLQNKIGVITTRVPVANGALADFSLQMKDGVSVEQVNKIFREASLAEYKGIVQYTEEPLVSADIKGNTHSAIVDGGLTSVVGRQVKLMAFFDNEFGYTSRVIDWLKYWKKFL